LKLYEEGGDMESDSEPYSISAPTEEKPDYTGYSNETIANLNKLDALDKLDDITEYQEPVSEPEDDYYSIRKRRNESSEDNYWDSRPKSNDSNGDIFNSNGVSASINQGGFEVYRDRIEVAANRNGIAPSFLAAILDTESSFDPDVISGKKRSSAKAIGIAQFMPATEKEYGIDATDPNQSIEAAAKKLSGLVRRYNGDLGTAAMAYNAGEGKIQKVMKGLESLPKETKEYMPKVLGRKSSYDKIFNNQ
jgi:soluble lytic murein transglycosylase-like protein